VHGEAPSATAWAALAIGALLVGFAKTAVGGVSLASVGIFAAILPARESTGTLLLLLVTGDIYATVLYRQYADWRELRRLSPSVVVGITLGVVFLAIADDSLLRRTIGCVLLILVVIHLVCRNPSGASPFDASVASSWPLTAGAGALAGFTSMVANAGGAAMTLYMLRAGMSTLTFLGTGAWFFFVVNVSKVPLSIGLGLLTIQSVGIALVFSPMVLAGGWIGRRVIARVEAAHFEKLVLVFTVLAGLNLLR
jgi:uncharacterized membrane protein YfcA